MKKKYLALVLVIALMIPLLLVGCGKEKSPIISVNPGEDVFLEHVTINKDGTVTVEDANGMIYTYATEQDYKEGKRPIAVVNPNEGTNTTEPTTNNGELVVNPDGTVTTKPNEETQPTTPTENMTKLYKHESDHLKVSEMNMKDAVVDIAGDYIMLGNHKVYYYATGAEKLMDRTVTEKFDSMRLINGEALVKNTVDVAGIKDNKIYLHWGNTSFYYEPKDYKLLGMSQSEFAYSLYVLLRDETNNSFVLQDCQQDGTIKEYKVKFVKWENYEHVVQNLDIKQHVVVSAVELLIVDANGNVYKCKREYEAGDFYEYTVEQQTGDKGQLTNVDYLFSYRTSDAIYADKNNSQEIRILTDWQKNEYDKITLPNGVTTHDIEKIYVDSQGKDQYMLLFTKSGDVYYNLVDDFKDYTDFVKSDALSELQKNGDIIKLAFCNRTYHMLLSDNNVYKVQFGQAE